MWKWVLTVALGNLCTLTEALAVTPRVARLATGESYKPLIDFQQPGGGPLVENVRQIFADMGLKVQIESMPWKRAYLETQRTTYLATFPWYKDSERERDFLYSDPLFHKPTVALVRQRSKVERISPQTIGVLVTCDILGSTVWDELKAKTKVRVVYVNDPEQCHQMLVTGRIDFWMTHPNALGDVQKQGLKVVADDMKMTFTGHLIISRALPSAQDLMQKFNRSLKKLTDARSLQPVFTANP